MNNSITGPLEVVPKTKEQEAKAFGLTYCDTHKMYDYVGCYHIRVGKKMVTLYRGYWSGGTECNTRGLVVERSLITHKPFSFTTVNAAIEYIENKGKSKVL